MIRIARSSFYKLDLSDTTEQSTWVTVPGNTFNLAPMQVVDGALVASGPWWFDGNHVAPGVGWLQLIAVAYFASWLGTTESTIGAVDKQPELRNTTLSFEIKLTDFVLPPGAQLVFWFQAFDPKLPAEDGQMVNYALKTPVLIEGGTTDWTRITLNISDKDADWIPLGSSLAREPTYSTSASVADALTGILADAGFIVLLGNPDELVGATGEVAFRNIEWSTPDHAYLNEAALNGDGEALGLDLALTAEEGSTLAGATLRVSVTGDLGSLGFEASGQIEQNGADLLIDGRLVGAITDEQPGRLSILLAADATSADAEALIAALHWQNSADLIDGEIALTVEIEESGGDLSSYVHILATAAQDDPASLSAAAETVWDESSAAALIASDLTVADPDGVQDFALRIVVQQPVAGDVLTLADPGPFIQGFDPAAAVLVVTGRGSPEDLQAALRSLSYQGGDNPDFYGERPVVDVRIEVLDSGGNVTGVPLVLQVQIGDLVDDPVSLHVAAVDMWRDEVFVITSDHLSYRDPEVRPERVVFTLAGSPLLGELLLDGSPVTSFSQADIDRGGVVYRSRSGGQDELSLTVAITDWSGLDPTLTAETGEPESPPIVSLPISIEFGIRGTIGNDQLSASDLGETVSGLAGDDLLLSGAGDDAIVGGDGEDTVSYAGAVGAVTARLHAAAVTGHGTDSLAEIEHIAGSAFDDVLEGDASANTLRGGEGNDTLDGFGGADMLEGGTGDDLYLINDAEAELAELEGEGTDEIRTSLSSYRLAAGVSVEALTFTGSGDAVLTGNADANMLSSGGGADILDSGGGVDRLAGGGGDDWYFVHGTGEIIDEVVSAGAADRVFAAGTYVLNAGAEIEILTTSYNPGTEAINLTGNEVAQRVHGNEGVNSLRGGDGDDQLFGAGGDDRLQGDQGRDFLAGGTGNDWYFVDGGDLVDERIGQGTHDRVFASASFALMAGAHIEVLSTDNHGGAMAINLTGNEFGQIVQGNEGANLLQGGDGNDNLIASGGDDRLFGDAGDDILQGGAAHDQLDGGAGTNRLMGGLGSDWYFIHHAADVIQEASELGSSDRVFASVNYALARGVEIEILSTDFHAGVDAINLTGNELGQVIQGNEGANVLKGLDGNDTLIGGGGNDQLHGGGGVNRLDGGRGNDWYYVEDAGDTITERTGEGNADRVFSRASYALSAEAEVETFSTDHHAGTAAIDLTGNGFAQLIYGNDGANRLFGKGGDDALIGGAGDDVLDGGEGLNRLTGGLGADVFLIGNISGATGRHEQRIADFTGGEDKIALVSKTFGLKPGELSDPAFRTGTQAEDATDRILYDARSNKVWFDADGTGAASAVLVLTLELGRTLTVQDFFVI